MLSKNSPEAKLLNELLSAFFMYQRKVHSEKIKAGIAASKKRKQQQLSATK